MDEGTHATDQQRILPSSGLTGELGGSLEEQLARAQERLAFYESFDGLIQENIARSGELLRQAMDMRESAIQEMALARQQAERVHAEAEQRVAAERERQRADLAALLDELNRLQQSVAGLVGRVSDALSALDARLAPAASDAAPAADSPAFDGAPAATEQANGFAPEFAPPDAGAEPSAASAPEQTAVLPDQAATGETGWSPDVAASDAAPAEGEAAPDAGWQTRPFGATALLASHGGPGDSAASTGAPSAAPSDATANLDPRAPRPVMVLVHGVPRAAAALSLQRHLAGLAHVDAVEAREYAEGVLRLQVVSRGPLQLDDIRRWEGGAGLEPVHVLDDVIEVRLPGATGF